MDRGECAILKASGLCSAGLDRGSSFLSLDLVGGVLSTFRKHSGTVCSCRLI